MTPLHPALHNRPGQSLPRRFSPACAMGQAGRISLQDPDAGRILVHINESVHADISGCLLPKSAF